MTCYGLNILMHCVDAQKSQIQRIFHSWKNRNHRNEYKNTFLCGNVDIFVASNVPYTYMSIISSRTQVAVQRVYRSKKEVGIYKLSFQHVPVVAY